MKLLRRASIYKKSSKKLKDGVTDATDANDLLVDDGSSTPKSSTPRDTSPTPSDSRKISAANDVRSAPSNVIESLASENGRRGSNATPPTTDTAAKLAAAKTSSSAQVATIVSEPPAVSSSRHDSSKSLATTAASTSNDSNLVAPISPTTAAGAGAGAEDGDRASSESASREVPATSSASKSSLDAAAASAAAASSAAAATAAAAAAAAAAPAVPARRVARVPITDDGPRPLSRIDACSAAVVPMEIDTLEDAAWTREHQEIVVRMSAEKAAQTKEQAIQELLQIDVAAIVRASEQACVVPAAPPKAAFAVAGLSTTTKRLTGLLLSNHSADCRLVGVYDNQPTVPEYVRHRYVSLSLSLSLSR